MELQTGMGGETVAEEENENRSESTKTVRIVEQDILRAKALVFE